VHNSGDATHAHTERVWDIILTKRLAEMGLPVVYGIATDDSHKYHDRGFAKNNPGEAWIMVRAEKLAAKNLIKAIEDGDFYGSSGVRLKNIKRDRKAYSVEIDAEPGVDYVTQFIGTRKGYDSTGEPVRSKSGTPLRVTHKYSDEIGETLAMVQGPKATYKLRGDEIYVRAKVISSKSRFPADLTEDKRKKLFMEEFESAWCQPVVTGVK